MVNSTGFKDLEIYKSATALRRQIFDLVKRFPKEERYRLSDQLIRSTRKCPANIGEGHGRYHYQENIQYCRIARGSLCETIDHLATALECNYMEQKQHDELVKHLISLLKMLNGYINYLRKEKLVRSK